MKTLVKQLKGEEYSCHPLGNCGSEPALFIYCTDFLHGYLGNERPM